MIRLFKASWTYLLLPLLISLFIFYVLQTPRYSGVLQVLPNKYNPITIKRDKYGVPSIESKTLKDTLYGLGYVQAQDRLWAMHSRRLLVAGRISEIAGEKTLEVDKFFRNIGIARYCEYAMEYMDQDTKEYYEAFLHGVNDYVASSTILPLEFWITWTNFEPLTILDAFANAKFVAFFLTFDFPFEFVTDTLDTVLGPKRAAELMPYESEKYLWKDVVIMNDDELKQSGIYEAYNPSKTFTAPRAFEFPEGRKPPVTAKTAQATQNAQNTKKAPEPATSAQKKKSTQPEPTKVQNEDIPLIMPEAQTGSNAWVIHGNYTTTGKPILANDPHLMNSIPSVWYPASMFYEGNYASGMSLVGFPGIHVGRTKDATWGITTLLSDTADLYTLQIKDNKYFYEGEWHALKEFKESIKVRGRKEPVEITIYESHHGIVLDYYFPDLFINRNFRPREGQRYALAWTGYTKKDNAFKSFPDMLKAKTSKEILEAWKDVPNPAFALLFATTQGDIGFLGMGLVPIRRTAHVGLKPQDGSLKENDWLGFVPWEDQLKIVNPKKGFIVSANNKMSSDNTKWATSAALMPTSRATRIDEMIRDLIKKNKKVSVQDMITIQLDTLDVLARDITPIMSKRTREALQKGYALKYSDLDLGLLLDNLTNWDYVNGKESIPASIFNVWERFFMRKMIRKIGFGERDVLSFYSNAKLDHFLFRIVLQWDKSVPKDHDFWCKNDENEDLPNPCLYNLAKSLEETKTYLEENFGKDIEDWEWGKVHKMDYPHGTFSPTPLKAIFHRSIPAGGNGRTVNVARMKMDSTRFEGVWSPNLKMVVSLKEDDKSYFIVDTGVSGNVFSPHYDDLMELLRREEYLELAESPRDDWKDVLYLKVKSK